MEAKIEHLCDNEWLSLLKLVDPDNHINGYVYSHESRCNGKIIAILPFRFEKGVMEFLLRHEVTPCWDRLRQVTSSITGGWEKIGEVETARKELLEEAGYRVAPKELIPLGQCYASKSTDTRYTLYTIDLTNHDQVGTGKGDGSKLEELAECFWAPDGIIKDVWDPLVSVMFVRILHLLSQAKQAQVAKSNSVVE